jgi:hypothetical protein
MHARLTLAALVLTMLSAGPASADGCWSCYRARYPAMTQVIYDPPPLIYNRPCWGPARAVAHARLRRRCSRHRLRIGGTISGRVRSRFRALGKR